jgi:hypothetical protein
VPVLLLAACSESPTPLAAGSGLGDAVTDAAIDASDETQGGLNVDAIPDAGRLPDAAFDSANDQPIDDAGSFEASLDATFIDATVDAPDSPDGRISPEASSTDSSASDAVPADVDTKDAAADAPTLPPTEQGTCAGSDAGVMDSSLDANISDEQPDGASLVSFANDIVPILQANCAAAGSACHGDPSVVTASAGGDRDYLGPPTGAYSAAVITQILGAIVGTPSLEDPSMNVVTAGEPTKSFLMYKIDGNSTVDPQLSSLTCTGDLGNCGTAMPYPGIAILPQATRDTIRTWINQGAMNN